MEGYIIGYLIFTTIMGFVGIYIAEEKGRSLTEGFLFGFFFSLIGLIIVAVLPTKLVEKQNSYEVKKPIKMNDIQHSDKSSFWIYVFIALVFLSFLVLGMTLN
jgi:CDP-diglyceride synthetase